MTARPRPARRPCSTGRRLATLLLPLAVLAGACTTAKTDPPRTSTTTTVPKPTTTLAPTGDASFGTRVKGVLTVGTTGDLAPFLTRAGGTAAGLEQDVARAVASRLQVGEVRFVETSMVTMVGGLDCGCDLYLGRIRATAELARSVDLSQPYVKADQTVVHRVGALPVTKASAKTLRWVTTFDDTAALRVVDRDVQPTHRVLAVTGQASVLAALQSGQADAALLDAPYAIAAVAADPTLELVGRFATNDGWVFVLPIGSSGTPSLNDVLDGLEADGTLAFIARRWLGRDPATIPVVSDK